MKPFDKRLLEDLPNQEGFKFVGITHDNEYEECVVVKDAIGCHSVNRIADGEPFFMSLKAWRLMP